MNDEQALHAAIDARPGDQTPRLLLADYYDDNDKPHHAAIHRIVAHYDKLNTPGADLTEFHGWVKGLMGTAGDGTVAHLASHLAHQATTALREQTNIAGLAHASQHASRAFQHSTGGEHEQAAEAHGQAINSLLTSPLSLGRGNYRQARKLRAMRDTAERLHDVARVLHENEHDPSIYEKYPTS